MYSSKCGDFDLIEHRHDQLNGTVYGQRIRYYK